MHILIENHENDHSVRAQIGCFQTFRPSNKSGVFRRGLAGKGFLEPIISITLVS
jgi:hypothetical protein